MNESQMTLGQDWFWGIDPTGWLASEKLDGCRAFWNGSVFWTRAGNSFQAPAHLSEMLPNSRIDGEIWAGRGQFKKASSAVRFAKWSDDIRFVAHDFPDEKGNWMDRMMAGNRSWIWNVGPPLIIKSKEQLRWLKNKIQVEGGEGLVIRNPATIGYEIGRTKNLLKVK